MRALVLVFLALGCTRPNPEFPLGKIDSFGKAGGNSAVDCSTQSDCVSCCTAKHNAGHNLWVSSVRLCECGGGGSCASACTASFCSDQLPDTNCDLCIQGDFNFGTCSFTSTCTSDADCTAWVECTGGCPT